MGVQARELARFAKKNGITVRQLGQAHLKSKTLPHCVLGVLSHMVGHSVSTYSDLPEKNLSSSDILSLEDGFEGWDNINGSSTYYKVGQNFRRISRQMGTLIDR